MPRPLTPAETQILGLAARGHSPRDIAHQLGVEERVVRNTIARIRRLLSARDLHHAIQIHQTPEHGMAVKTRENGPMTDSTPRERLRQAVLTQDGDWTVQRATEALGLYPAVPGFPKDDPEVGEKHALPSRATYELQRLTEEGLLAKDGRVWRRPE